MGNIQELINNGKELLNKTFSSKKSDAVRDTKRKILVVDDDHGVVNMIKQMLLEQNSGYVINTAKDGVNANKKIVSFKPDIVILDIMLPGIDGLAVCKQIKSNPDTQGIKILAMTGFYSYDREQQMIKHGADAFIRKPFDMDVFLGHINKFIA
jgi:DNA-binding response OmpR family regulator